LPTQGLLGEQVDFCGRRLQRRGRKIAGHSMQGMGQAAHLFEIALLQCAAILINPVSVFSSEIEQQFFAQFLVALQPSF